ncbi:BA14K family protein [Rhodomicrobium sp. R_RK_3]|nr:BA14K family protein [Rhodomicrobium sp. R_RK_3]
MVKPAESGADHLIEVGGRSRAPEAHLSVGPSYRYYDYPYYYSRGYYPTHIGPHYVYDYPDGSTSASYYDEDDEGGAPYSAQERCARRFKSFDWDTGRYTTYGGRSKLCPYLR